MEPGLRQRRLDRGFDVEAAYDHLSRRDRRLGAWMKRLGPLPAEPRWRKPFDPVDALARAILFQQLSGKAASTIVGRAEAAIGSTRLHHDTLGRIDDAALRACGVSGNKTLALRDLAARVSRGEIPDLRRMDTMLQVEIVAALVPVSSQVSARSETRLARQSWCARSSGVRGRPARAT